jgi:hypothetical protein
MRIFFLSRQLVRHADVWGNWRTTARREMNDPILRILRCLLFGDPIGCEAGMALHRFSTFAPPLRTS